MAIANQAEPDRLAAQQSDRRLRVWLWGFFGLLALLQLALIVVPRADGHLIGSDGIYYFSYLRSWLLEGNPDISSEIALYNASLPPAAEVEIQMRDAPHLNYAYAIGTPILWLPFFLLGHGIVLLLHALGQPVALHGYTYWEEAAVCLGGLIYGCLGIWIVWRWLGARFGPGTALTATLGTVAGTFLIYYLLFEASMSHACSLFAAAWFFSLWLPQRTEDQARTAPGWLLGLAAGLMVLVRWQNLVLVLACLPLLIAHYRGRQQAVQNLVTMAGTALLVVFPQMLFWKLTMGSWLTIPQGPHFIDWAHPQILTVLFTLQHGLISWTPLTALCLIGLGLYARRDRPEALSLGLAFALMCYVNAAVTADIGGGAAFGMRRFDSCGPIFALGLAALLQALPATLASRWLSRLSLAALIAWNALFIVQYRLHFIDPIAPITFDELVMGKVRMIGQVGDKIRQRLKR